MKWPERLWLYSFMDKCVYELKYHSRFRKNEAYYNYARGDNVFSLLIRNSAFKKCTKKIGLFSSKEDALEFAKEREL